MDPSTVTVVEGGCKGAMYDAIWRDVVYNMAELVPDERASGGG
jgi:hypothetical protein